MLTPSIVIGGLVALAPPPSPASPGTEAALPTQVAPAEPSAPAATAAGRDRPGQASGADPAPTSSGPSKRAGRRAKRRGGEASSRRGGRKPPWRWPLVGAHYGTGVMTSLLVLPGTYALAGFVGHQGKGLGPVVGSMLIGAFLPSPIIYTAQWAVARRLAARRHRFWPGLLVHQAGHLAVFAGAVLGGASFREFRDAAPVVLADALAVSALSSLTSEATRRPSSPEVPELSWERHARLWKPQGGLSVVVPVVKLRF